LREERRRGKGSFAEGGNTKRRQEKSIRGAVVKGEDEGEAGEERKETGSEQGKRRNQKRELLDDDS